MRKPEREGERLLTAEAPSLDRVFDLLSERRRRHTLYCLYEAQGGVVTLEEIIEYVLSLEGNTGSPEHREQLKVALEHKHLPRLEDAGIVEYDSRSETVRRWGQPSLEEWLDHARHKERV